MLGGGGAPNPAGRGDLRVDLASLLEQKRILVCCGSGGTGKTTVAAALAVQAALVGKNVLALTIDPARRLAASLGLSASGNAETRVPAERFLACGVRPSGSLHAMMLDTKSAFDDVIARYAPSEEIRDNVLRNRFYQNLSTAMAGSHEYLAAETLYRIFLEKHYDLIILDTPPTRHALDFLEAPSRVKSFFDRRISSWFLQPTFRMGRLGWRVFHRTTGTVFRMVEKVTGAEFLRDVSEFLGGLADAFDIFRSRADEVLEILRSDGTAFVLVTRTDPVAVSEASFFFQRLRERGLPLGACIVNKVHGLCAAPPASNGSFSTRSLTHPEGLDAAYLRNRRALTSDMAEELMECYRQCLRLASRETERLQDLRSRLSGAVPMYIVPALDEDVFDLAGLLRIGVFLVPGSPEPDAA